MPRNLDRRIETLFPIEDLTLKQDLIETLEMSLADNVNARLLHADGSYTRLSPQEAEAVRDSQAEFTIRARSQAVQPLVL
jgi:polyphosphate kinase